MKGTQGYGLARTRAVITGMATTFFVLSGCLSDRGGSDNHWAGEINSDITISGSVGDGPTVNASIRVRSSSGKQLAEYSSDSTGSYRIEVNVTDRQFPLLIDATGGTDIVTNARPDFVLSGAVLSSRDSVTANLNPFSTFAVEIAKDMNGGLTSANLRAAEDIVVSFMNSGLSATAASGPMQTPVDGSNIAEIVKASETLAEIVRRTRDAMLASGRGTNANAVR